MISSSLGYSSGFSPEGYKSRVNAFDDSDKGCTFERPQINLKTDIVLGLGKWSDAALRVEPGLGMVSEGIIKVDVQLISATLDILNLTDLKIRNKITKIKTPMSFTSDYQEVKGPNIYVFVLSSAQQKLVEEKRFWQIRVITHTKKKSYTDMYTLNVYDKDLDVKVFYPEEQCYFTTPAQLASELYYNPDPMRDLILEYSPKILNEKINEKERTAGFIEIQGIYNRGDRVGSGNFGTSASLQLFSSKEWMLKNDNYVDIVQQFTLMPLAYGHVVRQDMVKVTPVQKLVFSKCGMLVDSKEPVVMKTDVQPAYTLMGLDSSNFNNQEIIKTNLQQYVTVNTCSQKGVKK